MTKNNVRAITAEGEMTFDDGFNQLRSIVVAEVPITDVDKQGGRPITVELANMEFLITNAPKLDDYLPKNVPITVFADDDKLLKEKQRQLQEVKRLQQDIENQIAVIKIRIKNNVREFYTAALKAGKFDSTLKYIRAKMEEWYAKAKSKDDGNGTDTPTDKPV